MTRRFIAVLAKITLALAIFIVHIAIANILPPPWNKINLILLASIWLLIFRDNFNFIYYAFALSILSEFFHSTPFGLNTAALIITVIIFDWLLLNLLTNRFFLIVTVAGTLSVVVYRLITLILIYIWNIFSDGSVLLGESFYLDLLWESAVNGAVLTIAYLVPILFFKKLNPRYLTDRDYGHRSDV